MYILYVSLLEDFNCYVVGYPDLKYYWLGKKGEIISLPEDNAKALFKREKCKFIGLTA